MVGHGEYSPAARYFRGLIELDDENECNLCNGAKWAALRLLANVRSEWLDATKAEVLELAFERVPRGLLMEAATPRHARGARTACPFSSGWPSKSADARRCHLRVGTQPVALVTA